MAVDRKLARGASLLLPLVMAAGCSGESSGPSPDSDPIDAGSDPSVQTITTTVVTNECATPKAGWIFCDDFEQDRLAKYFEYAHRNGSFVRTTGVGANGSSAMRTRFAKGQVDAGYLHLAIGKTPQSYIRPADAGVAKYRELYWRLFVRNQPGWIGGGGWKLSRSFVFASSSSWAQAAVGNVVSSGTGHTVLAIDPISGTDVAGKLKTTTYNDFANFRRLGIARTTTPLFSGVSLGAWHCVEARIRLNDAGQANGVFEIWVDGIMEASRTGLNWVGGFNGYGLNAVFIENYWNNGAPQAQERYLDNLVVSTAKVGC